MSYSFADITMFTFLGNTCSKLGYICRHRRCKKGESYSGAAGCGYGCVCCKPCKYSLLTIFTMLQSTGKTDKYPIILTNIQLQGFVSNGPGFAKDKNTRVND
jgi:hypothetical protein